MADAMAKALEVSETIGAAAIILNVKAYPFCSGPIHSTRLIAKYRFHTDLKLAALDNIFPRQKGLFPGHAISSS